MTGSGPGVMKGRWFEPFRQNNRKCQMDDEIRRKIEEIIGQMECSKDFKCTRKESEQLCNAGKMGVDGLLYCLEDNPMLCKFALPFGFTYVCRCPLRGIIARKIAR